MKGGCNIRNCKYKVGAVFKYEKDKSGASYQITGFAVLPDCFVCMPAPEVLSAASPRSRRRKLCLHRFRASTKAHPARCSSSPHKIFDFVGTPNNAQSYPVRTVIQLSRIAESKYPPSSLDKGVPKNNLVGEKSFIFLSCRNKNKLKKTNCSCVPIFFGQKKKSFPDQVEKTSFVVRAIRAIKNAVDPK